MTDPKPNAGKAHALSTYVPAALFLCAVLAPACHRNPAPANSAVPPQVVRMDSEVLEEFYEEVQEYVRLRHKAVDVVPPLPAEATAEQIATRQQALTAA